MIPKNNSSPSILPFPDKTVSNHADAIQLRQSDVLCGEKGCAFIRLLQSKI